MEELVNDLTQRINSLGAVIGRCRKLKRDVTELERRRAFLEENLRLLKGGYKLPKGERVCGSMVAQTGCVELECKEKEEKIKL